VTVYLSQDLRFLGPVAVGETVTAECEVVEDLGRDKYELTTTVYDGDGEVVVDGEAVVMMAPFPEGSERPGDVLEGAPADGDATTDGGPAQLQ
jgi:acyl-CoA thioesterase FadM